MKTRKLDSIKVVNLTMLLKEYQVLLEQPSLMALE
jgi:hypothetical protein